MAEGEEPFRRFVDTYLRHPAGIPHDLVVIFKGFEQSTHLERAKSIFASVPHVGIEVDDDGFDIGAYLKTARILDHDYMCFLNTFTTVAADGWLANMDRQVVQPGVGIVGCMGSYESLFNSVVLINKVCWMCNEEGIDYDKRVAFYYDFIVNDHCKVWKAKGDEAATGMRAVASAIAARLSAPLRSRHLRKKFKRRSKKLSRPGQRLAEYNLFPPFPNPHVRSNGFMIMRQRLIEMQSQDITTKLEACAFESGSDSLTWRLRRMGLAAVVVGRDGKGYDVPEWVKSGTFRLGDQANLLLTDNQTRNFDAMTPGTRATHVRMTWGDYLGPAPADFPGLGCGFAVDRRITGRVACSRAPA